MLLKNYAYFCTQQTNTLLDKTQFILDSSDWYTNFHRASNSCQNVKVAVLYRVYLLQISIAVECEELSALIEVK
jgi:hypothetical protein